MKVSVIIPSWDGYRAGNVPRLLEQIKNQSFQDVETLVVQGISPNGRARNQGAQKTKGEILIFIDDDVTLGHDRVLENLVNTLKADPAIGMTGPSMMLPPEANAFQKAYARQLPRNESPVVDDYTDSDMVCHMCLAIRRDLYEKLGGEHDELVRGTDPDLRHRVRQAGYRVVLAPKTWAYHPPPSGWKSLLRGSFWNGAGSAWVSRHFPHLSYETAAHPVGDFVIKQNFLFRSLRLLAQTLLALVRGHWIFVGYRLAYSLGYLRGLLLRKEEGHRIP